MSEFNESDHPRDGDGKFASGGGSSRSFEVTTQENNMTVRTQGGYVAGKLKKDGLHINSAELSDSQRGKGVGKKMYMALIDQALSEGKDVFSDTTVETPAARVYESLEKEGYTVEKLPHGILEADEDLPEGALYGRNGNPVFKITGKKGLARPKDESVAALPKNAPAEAVVDKELLGVAAKETARHSSFDGDLKTDARGVIPGTLSNLNNGIKVGRTTLDGIKAHYGETRALLKARYGDELTLWRADAPKGEHHADTKVVFAGDKKLAAEFATDGRQAKPYRVKTDDVLGLNVDEKGYYEFLLAIPHGGLKPMTDDAKADSTALDMVNDVVRKGGIVKKAAGILFVTDGGKVLMGKRANYGDYPGYWGCFGGHQESGETDELTAIRECLEETGHAVVPVEMITPKGEVVLPPPLQSIAKTITDGTEFTYFVNVCKPFDVVINDEHTEYGWFSMGDLPDGPLHPGMLDVLNMPEFKSLRMTKMHETDIARAVANGALPSPTKFANVSFYRMRVTGTGTAFRRGSAEEVDKNGKVTRKKVSDEFVYRHPDNYLTADFLDRCQGLPVIFEHPKNKVLNSKEFSDRMIGVIVCPYIVDDEVWGVAKIYDEDSVTLLDNEKMSTSPTVVFHDRSENHTIALNDGSVLLIEGRPSLLDHVAVCEQGVWDKGGEPAGVESELAIADAVNPEKPNGASEMDEAEIKAKADAEEKAKADAAKADATPPAWADAFMKRMDAVESLFKNHKADADEKAKADAKADADEKARCDAEEKAKADAEEKEKKEAAEKAEKDKPAETAADKKADEEAKAKADAEEKERADAKADSVRRDKELSELKRTVAALTGAVHISDADRVQLAEIQSRADTVENAFGGRASAPVPGETPVAYRKRLAAKFKTHSKAWATEDVGALSDSVLAIAETQIYADALAAASSPADVPAGTLREIIKIDRVGRKISEFVGAKSAWMDQFKSPAQLQVRINKEIH